MKFFFSNVKRTSILENKYERQIMTYHSFEIDILAEDGAVDLVAAEDHGLFISECVVSERVGRST